MKTTKELLGARIKELRKSRNISQDKLAERINVDPKHLSRIEVGKGFPSLDTLENIARELNLEMKDFFEFTHLDSADALKESIDSLLKSADEEKLRRIQKLIHAVVH